MAATVAASTRIELSNEALAEHGASLGCGIVVALPAGSCPVAETVRVAIYLATETARQCGPCVHGTAAIARTLHGIAEGKAVAQRLRRPAALERGAARPRRLPPPQRARQFRRERAARVRGRHSTTTPATAPASAARPSRCCAVPDRGGTRVMQIRVNPIECLGHGLCAEILPERIRLDEWGYPIVKAGEVPRRARGARAPRRRRLPDARARCSRPSAGRAAERAHAPGARSRPPRACALASRSPSSHATGMMHT